MFVIKYFKRHPLLSIITILSLILFVFAAYMAIVTKLSSAINIAEKQVETSIKLNKKILDFLLAVPASTIEQGYPTLYLMVDAFGYFVILA